MTLKNNVPATLRRPLTRAETIIPVVVTQQYGDDVNEAIEFIAGALDHQEKITATKEDGSASAKTFPVVIDKVEVFERRASGSLLGTKAKIHFHDAKDTKAEPESIDTGWLEYHGSDAREFAAWQTSLSNTLKHIAEQNRGKQCFLTKAYISGVETRHSKSGTVKFLANLEPDSREAARGGSRGGRGESAGAARRRSTEVSADALADAVEAVRGFDREQTETALGDKGLLRSVLAAINEGGPKAPENVLDAVIDVVGDKVLSKEDEDDFFDRAEADLTEASAWLLVASA